MSFFRKMLLAALLPLLLLEASSVLAGQEVQVRPGDDPDTLSNRLRSLAPGSVVRLMPGTYGKSLRISELRGTPQAPIRIAAAPGASLEGRGDQGAKSFAHGSGILLEKSSHVVIEGLTISGFQRGVTVGNCQSVTLKGNTIRDVDSYGIMSYRSDGTAIVENRIERCHSEHGIYVSDVAANIVIAKNIIRDTHVNGIHINGAVAGPVITDNQLERTGSFPTKEGGAGLTLVGGTTAPMVARNHFKNIYGQGITLDAPNAVIEANTFESCAWSGVLGLAHGTGLRLSGNDFRNAAVIPLQFSPAVIASMTAAGDRYSSTFPVCESPDNKRTYSLKEWQALGKDVQ
ncbi:nitrous oxide reductase family maturation protein NosD [Solidesulfovibrio sp.]|uniref:right-handed parallel beta-helix repeat-containing protein n=1 Tax=Solidesulfovibrio sp. TaxID=2910990 RepID=UPI002609F569|nr:right-handed parallel beta-helix repeat-containing protein [Solidesulfovibrio sp.]